MLSDDQRTSLVAQMGLSTGSAPELPAPILTLKRSIIRPTHSSDAPAMSAEANNPKVVTYMTNAFPHPYTIDSAHSWVDLCAKENPTMNFAICDLTNTFVGGIGLKPQFDINERTVELGYWLGERSWGKGIMGEVAKEFTDWVFRERPYVARVEAKVIEGNEGSIGVLKRAGFVFEGKRRKQVWKRQQLLDEYIFSVIREDWEQGAQPTG